MIPHSARRLNSETEYVNIIYKKMSLELNRTNFGNINLRNVYEEAKMRSSISRQLNQNENNSKFELDTQDAGSNYNINQIVQL